MGLFIIFALISVPMIEIAVFARLGSEIGVGLTIGITVFTAFAGAATLRIQGLSTLGRVHESLNRGAMPVRAVFDGACQLMAGVLLVIQGFVTDFFGLFLFLPLIRGLLLRAIVRQINIPSFASNSRPDEQRARWSYDIDGEHKEVKSPSGPKIDHMGPTDSS